MGSVTRYFEFFSFIVSHFVSMSTLSLEFVNFKRFLCHAVSFNSCGATVMIMIYIC